MLSSASVNVHAHLGEGERFEVARFPADQSGEGFVILRVPPQVNLFFSDPAVLEALIAAAVEARSELLAELTGQAPLPVEPESVGDTGLTLGRLPVGVS